MNKRKLIKICKEKGLKKIKQYDFIGDTFYIPYEASAIINNINVPSNLVEIIDDEVWFYFKRGKEGVPEGTCRALLKDIDILDFKVDFENPV